MRNYRKGSVYSNKLMLTSNENKKTNVPGLVWCGVQTCFNRNCKKMIVFTISGFMVMYIINSTLFLPPKNILSPPQPASSAMIFSKNTTATISDTDGQTLPVPPIANDETGNDVTEAAPVDQSPTIKIEKGIVCHLPVLNPLDTSILKYFVKPKPANCTGNINYPLLFTTDLRSTLIQVDNPEKYGYYFCCYHSFTRKGSDSSVDVSKTCEPITKVKTIIPENVEFIQIACANTSSIKAPKKVIDLFGFIHAKKPNDVKNESKANNTKSGKNTTFGSSPPEILTTTGEYISTTVNQLITTVSDHQYSSTNIPILEKTTSNKRRKVNVVILGLDAVSHMNFLRTMPLSYEYLTKNLSGLGLGGYTKVGDNTFPNIVPATTGLFVEELNETVQCWKKKSQPFDDCPFIWKNFSSQGYTTAYGEDAVWMGIFNYVKRGFNVQPTDYYYNTLTYRQNKFTGHVHAMNANLCYGPRLGFEILLDYLKKMAVGMNKEKRYFQFIWATSLTHDYLNEGKLGDQLLLETLQWFQNEGYFDDTVFVLMSDHGIRWGGIRLTLQGKLEERMPFLYFVFPQWFREQYLTAVSNVILNKHRLATPFDLHETLKDLLFLDNINSAKIRERHLKLKAIVENNERLPRGISLFLPIPLKRNCTDAKISDHWCVCRSTQNVVLKNNSLVIEAARSIVYFINGMFIKFAQCVTLQLQQVLNAQVFQSENKKIADASATITNSSDPRLDRQQVTFSLSLTVSPSGATFEATTTRHTDGSWIVSGGVSRINLYGNQSECVSDYNLKKYCYCG